MPSDLNSLRNMAILMGLLKGGCSANEVAHDVDTRILPRLLSVISLTTGVDTRANPALLNAVALSQDTWDVDERTLALRKELEEAKSQVFQFHRQATKLMRENEELITNPGYEFLEVNTDEYTHEDWVEYTKRLRGALKGNTIRDHSGDVMHQHHFDGLWNRMITSEINLQNADGTPHGKANLQPFMDAMNEALKGKGCQTKFYGSFTDLATDIASLESRSEWNEKHYKDGFARAESAAINTCIKAITERCRQWAEDGYLTPAQVKEELLATFDPVEDTTDGAEWPVQDDGGTPEVVEDGPQLPYIEKVVRRVHTEHQYNPKYGDDRICTCGHTYYRHFDTYEDMFNCGCKYCECHTFDEATETRGFDFLNLVACKCGSLHQANLPCEYCERAKADQKTQDDLDREEREREW